MKKCLAIIFLVIILFALANSSQAVTIVKDYPEIRGAVRPGEAGQGQELPQFIKYIFMFSLGIVGLVGMVAVIMGGFDYVTSSGNPQKAAEGKNKIVSALLGLLLLLGSWILLNLVNPDLLRLGITGEIATGPKGDYACYCCCTAPGLSCTPDVKRDCYEDVTASQANQRCDIKCKDSCTVFGVHLPYKYETKMEACSTSFTPGGGGGGGGGGSAG